MAENLPQIAESELLRLALYDTIQNNITHRWYKRTVDLAVKYKQCITGEDIESLLRQYCPMEDEETIKKMLQVTNPVLKCIVHRLIAINAKIPRSNSMTKTISYITKSEEGGSTPSGEDEKKRLKDFEENILGKFWGERNLDSYLSTRLIELIDRDPNAFIVCEWNEVDGKKENAKPYPFEALSENVINYKYEKFILQYLIVKNQVEKMDRYTIYGKNQTIVFQQVDEDKTGIKVGTDGEVQNKDNQKYITIKQKLYLIIEPIPHDLDFVPAFCVGTFRDQYTEGLTHVNTFDPALPYLMKSIKTCVESDITAQYLAFPSRWQYEKKCTHEGCLDGKLTDNSVCPTCQGTGASLKTHSAFHTITFPLPKPGEPITALGDMVHFHYPPIDILDFQQKIIDDIFYNCLRIIYNTEIFDKKEISETATGKLLDYQNLYDVLYIPALNYASAWKFFVDTCAKVTGYFNDSFYAIMSFGKDFALETEDDIIYKLDQQRKTGVPYEVIAKTESDLMRVRCADNPGQYRKYLKKSEYKPFRDKSKDEIAVILTGSGFCTKSDKVLYTNWEMIWESLELANPDINIYELANEALRKMLDEKVSALVELIKEDTPATQPFNRYEESTE